MESCLEGVHLIIIHYCFEKDMAKMDRNIKLRKHHKVKRTAIFSSSHTFFLCTLYFLYTKCKCKHNYSYIWGFCELLKKKKMVSLAFQIFSKKPLNIFSEAISKIKFYIGTNGSFRLNCSSLLANPIWYFMVRFYSMKILTFSHIFFRSNRVHLTSRMQTCCFPLWPTSLVQSLWESWNTAIALKRTLACSCY